MLQHSITGLFNTNANANDAVDELRRIGVADSQIAVLSRTGIDSGAHADEAPVQNDASREANFTLPITGVPPFDQATHDHNDIEVAEGVGAGALFGLAAFAMPGSAPFIAAGFLPSVLASLGAGSVIGGAATALHQRLAKAGYSENTAHDLSKAVERGATAVTVDVANSAVPADRVRAAIVGSGGELLAEAEPSELFV